MIFRDNELEKEDDITFLHDYHPWSKGGDITAIDKKIMNLKSKGTEEWQIKAKHEAIDFFSDQISALLFTDFVIVVVPSSKVKNTEIGTKLIALKLCILNNLIDGTSCLKRVIDIDSLHEGGDRSKEVHYRSIEVKDAGIFKGKEVLLLDDVTTSGNTLEACKELLLESGALKVKCLAIGQTQSSPSFAF